MKTTPTLATIDPAALYGLPKVARVLCVCWDTAKKLVVDGVIPHRMVRSRVKVLGQDLLVYAGMSAPVPLPPTDDEVLKRAEAARDNIRRLLHSKTRHK